MNAQFTAAIRATVDVAHVYAGSYMVRVIDGLEVQRMLPLLVQ